MYKDSELTNKIICSSYNVHNTLGSGFLEKVYENALCLELESLGFSVEQQVRLRSITKGNLLVSILLTCWSTEKLFLN